MRILYSSLSVLFFCLNATLSSAQIFTYSGTVVNAKLEPIPFINVAIKEIQRYERTDEQGKFSFRLTPGRYELVFSRVGYKTLQKEIILGKQDKNETILLEQDNKQLSTLVISAKQKDRSREIIRNVVEAKNAIQKSAMNYSFDAYIKASASATESAKRKKSKKKTLEADSTNAPKKESSQHFGEVYLNVQRSYPDKIKEVREGISIKGDKDNFFYLSMTEGDFDFYENLIRVRALGRVTFLSPFSISGLISYRYDYVGQEYENGKLYHHIKFRPSSTSNALLRGEVWIQDASWVIKKINASFPNAHTPNFKTFEITATYKKVNNKVWLPEIYEFEYLTRQKMEGNTLVKFSSYNIDTVFDKRFFNSELSSTSLEAYEKDSNFWEVVRPIPLTQQEIEIIHYRDSVYDRTHSVAFRDSVEKDYNKVRFINLIWEGQGNSNWRKERHWMFPALPELFRPIEIGGPRYGGWLTYQKKYPNKKELRITPTLNYSHVNKDFRGSLRAYYLLNPFNRTSLNVDIGRSTDNLFWNDAIINLFDRSNYYLRENLIVSLQREIINGLYISNTVELGFRKSMHDYIINTTWDSLLNRPDASRPIYFEDYSAFFNQLEIWYTPKQLYVREPYQKVILGSRYPTFFVKWRKGIPGLLKSIIKYDYIEAGIRQDLNLGTIGISEYKLMYGNFVTEDKVEAADYKFIARGNPYLFFNSRNSFQAMDSTFALFKGFFEGHLTHEFNGALLNKLPYMRKLKITESAGTGILIAPERNLRYVEFFAGIEKQFTILRQPLKFGVWGVSSFANQFQNPFQVKFSLRVYDNRSNKWF